jgi:SAM-dependent methyltransferase
MRKPQYGIDAPGVIRNLFLIAIVAVILYFVLPSTLRLGSVSLDLHSSLLWMAPWFALSGVLMLLYARVGKFRHRDRLLALHAWQGSERVLDVGTGRGLLLAGAAKQLTSGHATGIDIWNKKDLSGNSEQSTLENLRLEGVAERCTLLSVGAQQMSFPDASFDAILSNLCLHNIYNAAERRQACQQIARVLAPGGTAIISDYKLTREYAVTLRECGLTVERQAWNWMTTFPPLTTLVARKAR